VWYRNRARAGRKKFLKPWCGPWEVVKVLSDVTYRIEEEIRKPGRRRQRRVVHFNYLKPCHSPPQDFSDGFLETFARATSAAPNPSWL